ncbi:transient receptor potential cation channel subfamily M member-like 2 isoform X2 [Ptychodera flava]|uniref:transient receptor potential cation channel subfamily M member-like 2 isoform X2 n=1 Tax=Ptychodera flava TaxID=63121 RepID=UPI00396A2723
MICRENAYNPSEGEETELDEVDASPRVLEKISSNEWQQKVANFIKDKRIRQRKTEIEQENAEIEQEEAEIEQEDAKTEDADSFGEIEFVGFGNITNKKAPYIRVDKKTEPGILKDLLLGIWKMPRPNMLISVTGGHKNFFFKDERLKILFSKGLFKTALSTGAWLISDGTASGVMKLVGEAIKEESQGTTENEIVALGITNWNVLNNKEVLTNSSPNKGCWPAKYAESELKPDKQGNYGVYSTILECNHNYFIMVDHGKEDFEVDTNLRADLLQCIAEKEDAGNPEIPVVLVVVNGGYGTIKTVCESLGLTKDSSRRKRKKGIPMVIIKGSGRAADIIAEAHQSTNQQNSDADKYFKNAIDKILIDDTRREEKVLECVNWLKEIVQHEDKSLITIFQMGDANFKDIDKAILHGVLKAKTLNGNIKEQLKLAVALNRCDIAKDQIITSERRLEWQKCTDSLDEVVESALIDNKADFVEFFLAHIVDMDSFLTYDRLCSLYEKIPNENQSDADFRISTLTILQEKLGIRSQNSVRNDNRSDDDTSKNSQQNENEKLVSQNSEKVLDEVYSFLRTLTEGEYDAMYKERPRKSRKMSDHDKHLFLWAVLLNRRALAILFWKRLNTCNIGAALIAGRILRALSAYAKKDEELTLHDDLLQHAVEFERMATGVLDSCFEANKDLSNKVLVRTLPAWGNTTCLSIAYSAKHMIFMKQDCCQSKLQRVWKGNLLIHSKIQWLMFFVGTLLPIFSIMTFLSDDLGERSKANGVKCKIDKCRKFANYFFRWSSVYSKTERTVRRSGFEEEDVTFWEGMRYYYTAPITKFLYSMVSYIILLLLFAFFILTDLRPRDEANSPGIIEWVVVVWVGTLVVEEVRQLIVRVPTSIKYKAISWFSEIWNRFDLAMYLLFAVSFVLRLGLPPSKFATARVMYCVTFIAFCVRLLHVGFVFKEVGPKIIMIIKMVKDLSYFLIILVVFIAGFGVANEAILYPNMDPHVHLMVRSLYKPYWQLYGELFLEEIEGRVENETCYEDPRFMNLCPQVEEYRWVAPTLTAIYMLISNILLINLLIAMFSFTFQRVQDNAEVIWRFYRFGLISEYQDRPTLAPPLIVINHCYRFIIYLKNLCKKEEQESHSLAVRYNKDSREDEQLNLFERKHLQNYFIKKNLQEKNSVENAVTSTDERVDTLVHEVGEIKECIGTGDREIKECIGKIDREIEKCIGTVDRETKECKSTVQNEVGEIRECVRKFRFDEDRINSLEENVNTIKKDIAEILKIIRK